MVVIDINNLGYWDYTDDIKQFIQAIIALNNNSIPENLCKTIIVNSGMVFRGIWNVIKLWIDERTANKFTLLGSDYHDTLKEFIDIDQLPDIYGGHPDNKLWHQDGLFIEKGPWTKEKEVTVEQIDIKFKENYDFKLYETERLNDLEKLKDVVETPLELTKYGAKKLD
mmetsp:Transcript_110244/g.237292  ORF Transcript_110244/g.237292 Transcript_110244/m.237292 type:complete len:168 (+) Transcript_110244:509-1012(+)